MNIQSRSTHSSSSAPERFRVLDLEVDSGRQTVSRAGVELHVPKLSFDLLLTLVRATPNMVSVPDLMERVWPHQVVGIETLAQRVKLLRRALDDDAAQPRYLSGERRRGYRIIAPVVTLEPEPRSRMTTGDTDREAAVWSSPPQTPPPVAAPLPRRRRITLVLGFAVAVVIIAGLLGLLARGLRVETQSAMAAAPASAAPYSVAVLPFRGTSGREEDALLGRGISELVINRLTGEHKLSVIAADSALRPRREAESSVETGRRLGAHYVVDGSVQREGSQVRVTAELIDVPAGRHVGALLVERSTAELFRLQDDIAERVRYFLFGTAHPDEPRIQEVGEEAALAYLRGRALLTNRKVADADQAIEEFTRAIAFAPAFAAAYAGRAEARFQRVFVVNAYNENADRLFEQMQPDIDRALQLDPGNGPATFIRGKYRDMKGDEVGAESDFRRGMALSPGFAPGVDYYAEFLYGGHKVDEALSILDTALRINPLAPRLIYLKGLIVAQARHDNAAASELFLHAIQAAPDYYGAYNRLATLRWSEGRLAEAIGFAEASLRIEPGSSWSRENLARVYIDLGDLTAAREVLAHFQEPDKHEGAALLCYRAGRLDAAVAWLRPALTSQYRAGGGPALAASITALLEQATRSGDYAGARALLVNMQDLKDEHGRLDFNQDNALPLLQLATLEKLAGHRAEAERIATGVIAIVDDPTAQGNYNGFTERFRMLALAVLGRDREALSILEAQRDTLARELWWVWIERHPAFAQLRREPRVQQLLAELRSWSQKQRELVEAQRHAGKLPVRSEALPDPCAPPAVTALRAKAS